MSSAKQTFEKLAEESNQTNENTVLLIEQYASQILDFSSQYGSDNSYSYNATNCLGVPSKFPSYGKAHLKWICVLSFLSVFPSFLQAIFHKLMSSENSEPIGSR